MQDRRNSDFAQVETLLAPAAAPVALLPLPAIKESDHAFFWSAFFLSIATCLFGCAASLYASAYEHLPFIVLVAGFGLLFLVLFIAFALRGLHIRKDARAQEKLKRPQDILYDNATGSQGGRASAERIQESINRALGDGASRTREEILGVLSGLSTEEVDVGTLHQVLNALIEAGHFTETENNGKKLFTYKPAPVSA